MVYRCPDDLFLLAFQVPFFEIKQDFDPELSGIITESVVEQIAVS